MALNSETKPNYQPWNEEEFRSDIHVQSMTPVQRWMYRTLLQAAFFYSTRPYLPSNEDILWKLAGCEGRSQWDANKEDVLAMFQSVNIGGQRLLSQKRVVKDWERLTAKRETLVEQRRNAAMSRWGNSAYGSDSNNGSSDTGRMRGDAKVSKSEVESSEVESSEERSKAEPPRSFAKDENTPARVQELAAEILHYTKRLTTEERKELTLLGRAFPGQVADDFAAWAAEDGEGKSYPVAYYLRAANERLRDGATTARAERDPMLQPMMVSVAGISGYTPSGKSLAAGAKMLKTYGPDEIIAAFKEHVSNMDEFALKRSIQTFFEGGGGEFIVLLRRKRLQEKCDLERTMISQEAAMRAERELERMQWAADDRKAAEDLALILGDEPTIPSGEAQLPQETSPEAETGVTPSEAVNAAHNENWDDIPF